jgi:hypothetical protein
MHPSRAPIPVLEQEASVWRAMERSISLSLQKPLDDWSTGIDELQVRASLAKAELKVKYEQQIAELRKKRQEGNQQLSAIKAATDDSWEHLKGDAERTWKAFKGAVEEFKSRMK